jgi:hypothetical protein
MQFGRVSPLMIFVLLAIIFVLVAIANAPPSLGNCHKAVCLRFGKHHMVF